MPIPYGSYTRMSVWLKEDQFVLFIDFEGNETWGRIERSEPLGVLFKAFANAAHQMAPAAQTTFVEFPFLAPKRQMRMYQIRPFFVQEEQRTGRLMPWPFEYLWSLIDLQWEMPSGDKRGGTASREVVTIPTTGIANTIGGIGNGVINPAAIPYEDNPQEIYDLFTMFNVFPSFNIINNTVVTLGADAIPFPWQAAGADPLNFNHYLGFMGRKYILGVPSESEQTKLANRELDYRGITVGGLPPLTTRV